ncbi:hypothetical protein [Nocardia sp. BMG51109]|uniref:hypothetical protein n=1 Tax=Nocardia sp. BMG51109 TaxID=1056816 RepID=UPI00046509CE|nr:hypothetical protein [Nocardia sp. BMG51109]
MGFDWWRNRADENSVREIRERIEREQQAVGWTHEAPDQPLAVDDSHRILQQHRDCDVKDCPRKRAAWQTLVEAGRIKPDSSRTR